MQERGRRSCGDDDQAENLRVILIGRGPAAVPFPLALEVLLEISLGSRFAITRLAITLSLVTCNGVREVTIIGAASSCLYPP